MKDLHSQLQTPEALLLMYLADEMSAEDRREFERRLAADQGLAQKLAEMRDLLKAVERPIADTRENLDLRADRCAERTIAAMRRHAAESAAKQVQAPRSHFSLRLPRWSYPLAAAASILIAAAVFVANMEPSGPSQPAVVADAGEEEFPEIFASPAINSLALAHEDARILAEELSSSFDNSATQLEEVMTNTGLTAASRDMEILRQLSRGETEYATFAW